MTKSIGGVANTKEAKGPGVMSGLCQSLEDQTQSKAKDKVESTLLGGDPMRQMWLRTDMSRLNKVIVIKLVGQPESLAGLSDLGSHLPAWLPGL